MISRLKKIVFEDTEVNHASLKVRLRHDGIRQGEFFRFMLQKYIECADPMVFLVQELREEKGKYGRARNRKISRDIQSGQDLLKKFKLSDSQKEDIYDLLEKEHGDL